MERQFVKSGYSNSQGSCVEVSSSDTLDFRASSWSGGGNCLEVADDLADCIVMRDSKVPETYIHTQPEAFTAFVGWAATDEVVRLDLAGA